MSELSGAHWCERFPPSRSIGALVAEFAPKVSAFVGRLESGGARVSIADTYRPPQQ